MHRSMTMYLLTNSPKVIAMSFIHSIPSNRNLEESVGVAWTPRFGSLAKSHVFLPKTSALDTCVRDNPHSDPSCHQSHFLFPCHSFSKHYYFSLSILDRNGIHMKNCIISELLRARTCRMWYVVCLQFLSVMNYY